VAFDPTVIATAIGRFLNGSRLAFGGLVAAAFLALFYERYNHPWLVGAAVLFGSLLLWDSCVAAGKWLVERLTERRKKKAHELEAARRRDAALDNLTNEARFLLFKAVLAKIGRVNVPQRDPVNGSLATSPLVRFIGTTQDLMRQDWCEYEIEDWALVTIEASLAQIERDKPELFRELQRDALAKTLR
jgi:hypothetical protein